MWMLNGSRDQNKVSDPLQPELQKAVSQATM